jgi:hypothetical protein
LNEKAGAEIRIVIVGNKIVDHILQELSIHLIIIPLEKTAVTARDARLTSRGPMMRSVPTRQGHAAYQNGSDQGRGTVRNARVMRDVGFQRHAGPTQTPPASVFGLGRRLITGQRVWVGVFGCFKNVWVKRTPSRFSVVFCLGGRNPTKSVTRPQPPRGIAEVSGRETRPRHSRRYALLAHQARGAQPRRSPRDGRAKIRSYVKPAISASPATAEELTRKPPAFPQESGCAQHISRWNRRSIPCRSGAPLTKP